MTVNNQGDGFVMFGDRIEQMKRDYTDKYVLVDASCPELARFRDAVGRVKTVNMNGRALVEFDDYHLNIGWYDIAPEYLKVVDKPLPKAPKIETKKAPAPKAAAPAAKKTIGEPASASGAPTKPSGKPSVADILAAARGGKPSTAAAAKPAPTPAAPKAAAAASTKVDRSKMSVADMIAAARAGGTPSSTPSPPKAEAAAPTAPAERVEAAPAPAAASKVEPPAAKSTEKVDKSKMSIDDIIAWCREHDAK
jgi:hypothetical protein